MRKVSPRTVTSSRELSDGAWMAREETVVDLRDAIPEAIAWIREKFRVEQESETCDTDDAGK